MKEDICTRISQAICDLYRYDVALLTINANERSITHKLAEHMQKQFQNWDVDCEYNRLGTDPKKLILDFGNIEPTDNEGKTVYPDIIVHNRNTKENLLVIEFKKDSGTDDTLDRKKIILFTRDPSFQYRYGLILRLGLSGCSKAFLFENGSKTDNWKNKIAIKLKELGYGV